MEDKVPENNFSWIKRIIEFLGRTLIPAKLKTAGFQALPFWIASFITGLVAVGYAELFNWVERFSFAVCHDHRWLFFIFSPTFFIASWWIVFKFSKPSAGSGIPQLMAAIDLSGPKGDQAVDYLLNAKIIFFKIISNLLLVFGGGNTGREGPTIHVAGSIFRIVHKSIPQTWEKVSSKIMLITGGAAGLAAAFNTPLGGLVFAVEELTKTHITFFKTAVFTSVIIAGLTAQGILGSYLYLGYPSITNPGISILPTIILISVIAGLLGALMVKAIFLVNNWKNRYFPVKNQIWFVGGAGLLLAFCIYFNGSEVMGSGKPLMESYLSNRDIHVPWLLLPFRWLGSVFTYANGGACGVFATSLSAGAVLGAKFVELLSLNTGAGHLVILCSMIGFLTGVTKSPFTSAVLVLEMTDRHAAIFYFLLSGMAAYLTSFIVSQRSFYETAKEQFIEQAALA